MQSFAESLPTLNRARIFFFYFHYFTGKKMLSMQCSLLDKADIFFIIGFIF